MHSATPYGTLVVIAILGWTLPARAQEAGDSKPRVYDDTIRMHTLEDQYTAPSPHLPKESTRENDFDLRRLESLTQPSAPLPPEAYFSRRPRLRQEEPEEENWILPPLADDLKDDDEEERTTTGWGWLADEVMARRDRAEREQEAEEEASEDPFADYDAYREEGDMETGLGGWFDTAGDEDDEAREDTGREDTLISNLEPILSMTMDEMPDMVEDQDSQPVIRVEGDPAEEVADEDRDTGEAEEDGDMRTSSYLEQRLSEIQQGFQTGPAASSDDDDSYMPITERVMQGLLVQPDRNRDANADPEDRGRAQGALRDGPPAAFGSSPIRSYSPDAQRSSQSPIPSTFSRFNDSPSGDAGGLSGFSGFQQTDNQSAFQTPSLLSSIRQREPSRSAPADGGSSLPGVRSRRRPETLSTFSIGESTDRLLPGQASPFQVKRAE